MKKYRLKIDTPWASKGDLFKKLGSYWFCADRHSCPSFQSPEKYQELFEPIEEKSDEEIVADWLHEQIENGIEWEASAIQLISAGLRVEDLIDHEEKKQTKEVKENSFY